MRFLTYNGTHALAFGIKGGFIVFFKNTGITIDGPQGRAQVMRYGIGKCLKFFDDGFKLCCPLVNALLKAADEVSQLDCHFAKCISQNAQFVTVVVFSSYIHFQVAGGNGLSNVG